MSHWKLWPSLHRRRCPSFTQSTIRWLVENEDANKCFCQVACSHTRAIELYIESLKSRDCLFIGHRCDSYEDFKKVWTAFSPTAKMALKHDLFRCLKALTPIIWVQLELKSKPSYPFIGTLFRLRREQSKLRHFGVSSWRIFTGHYGRKDGERQVLFRHRKVGSILSWVVHSACISISNSVTRWLSYFFIFGQRKFSHSICQCKFKILPKNYPKIAKNF